MSSNFRPYRYGITDKPPVERLNIANIAVGDILIQASWNSSYPAWREFSWTVTKVLKTRLVLERTIVRGTIPAKTSIRVILTTSDYGTINGDVTDKIEGQSEYGRDRYYLFTPDEDLLAELREQHAAIAVKTDADHDARVAATAFINSRNLETAEAALAAFQAYVTLHKE